MYKFPLCGHSLIFLRLLENCRPASTLSGTWLNSQRKFDDISNTTQDDDDDSTSPAKKRRRTQARSEDNVDPDNQASVEESRGRRGQASWMSVRNSAWTVAQTEGTHISSWVGWRLRWKRAIQRHQHCGSRSATRDKEAPPREVLWRCFHEEVALEISE